MPEATRNWPEILKSDVLKTLDQEADFLSSKSRLQSLPIEEQEFSIEDISKYLHLQIFIEPQI